MEEDEDYKVALSSLVCALFINVVELRPHGESDLSCVQM